jgi:hypothetical protein
MADGSEGKPYFRKHFKLSAGEERRFTNDEDRRWWNAG